MAPSAGVTWLRGWVSFGALAPRFANQGVLSPSGAAVSFGGSCFPRGQLFPSGDFFLTDFSGAWASTNSSNRQAPLGQPRNKPQQLPQHQQIAPIGKHHLVARTTALETVRASTRGDAALRKSERAAVPAFTSDSCHRVELGPAPPCCSPCPTDRLGPVYSRANLHLNRYLSSRRSSLPSTCGGPAKIFKTGLWPSVLQKH